MGKKERESTKFATFTTFSKDGVQSHESRKQETTGHVTNFNYTIEPQDLKQIKKIR